MTEIFVEDDYFLSASEEDSLTIDERIAQVSEAMTKAIRQPVSLHLTNIPYFIYTETNLAFATHIPLLKGATVKVTRWFPGVLKKIVEEVKSETRSSVTADMLGTRVKDMLAKEATTQLETKQNLQITATQAKTLDTIKAEMGIPLDSPDAVPEEKTVTFESLQATAQAPPPTTTRRRVRQKMRSTPVVGGSLFDDTPPAPKKPQADATGGGERQADPFSAMSGGQMAELVVGGEIFHIRVMPETIHRIRSGYSGEVLDDASVRFSQKDVPIEHRLQGLVRHGGLETITEDMSDTASNKESDA